MKRLFIVPALLLSLLLISCNNGAQSNRSADVDLINNPITPDGFDKNAKVPVLTFDQEKHDFGRLSQGENIAYSFHFKNTGNADLIISSCSATCGCTVADYPRTRIAPGEEGYVTVSFHSAGKTGQQYQEVTVVSNAQPSRNRLIITAQVGA